jgi:predicted O-methyltransferase YrrM
MRLLLVALLFVSNTHAATFTKDWFTPNIPVWQKHLSPLADKPASYLEIGVFEGRSLFWVLENVLKHPDAKATAIDIEINPRYVENLKQSGTKKVTTIHARSQDALKTLPKASFDVIYIDGSHVAKDVLADAVLSFDLLKTGGLMIFDDYTWNLNWSPDMRPKIAVDAFLTAYRNNLEIVHFAYQVIVRKKDNPCGYAQSPVAGYCYKWFTGELLTKDQKPVRLSDSESKTIMDALTRMSHNP